MQMPQMARDVFMSGFIALPSVAVKSQLPANRLWITGNDALKHFIKHVGTVMKHSSAS
jgi:hypothetical protein